MARERGAMDGQFEAGYIPGDEPPGISERQYQAWKAAGGQVKAGCGPHDTAARDQLRNQEVEITKLRGLLAAASARIEALAAQAVNSA
jgi:hypothetical protein